jgi:quinol monooxygenase YgiN
VAKDDVKIRVPKRVERAAKNAVNAVAEGRDDAALEAHLHNTEIAEILFLKAEVAYLTDPMLRPPEYFFPLLRGGMSKKTYLERAVAARWEASREKVRTQAKTELIRRVSNQIIREQVKEAEEVNQLRQWMLEFLTPTRDEDGNLNFRIAPKSLEGMIKQFKEVSVLLQMYRQTVLQQVEPHAPVTVDEAHEVVRGPFTEEEAGQIAEQLLRKRHRLPPKGGDK